MTRTPDVRDDQFARRTDDGTVYDCADDGLFCELREIDGIVTCTECGTGRKCGTRS